MSCTATVRPRPDMCALPTPLSADSHLIDPDDRLSFPCNATQLADAACRTTRNEPTDQT